MNQNVVYRKDGVLHRDDGPAIVTPDGSKFYYVSGRLHRDDGPAIDSPTLGTAFFRNGHWVSRIN